jgi:hypothetical protein
MQLRTAIFESEWYIRHTYAASRLQGCNITYVLKEPTAKQASRNVVHSKSCNGSTQKLTRREHLRQIISCVCHACLNSLHLNCCQQEKDGCLDPKTQSAPDNQIRKLPPLAPLLVEAEEALDPQHTVSNGQPNRETPSFCLLNCRREEKDGCLDPQNTVSLFGQPNREKINKQGICRTYWLWPLLCYRRTCW